jgi:alpha-L-fucosidase
MFIHFNMGTFHDMEWVTPNLDPLTFAPTDVNTDQWAAAAKAGGMKFAVLTTKHHDGFCLGPTKLTSYDVMTIGNLGFRIGL